MTGRGGRAGVWGHSLQHSARLFAVPAGISASDVSILAFLLELTRSSETMSNAETRIFFSGADHVSECLGHEVRKNITVWNTEKTLDEIR